MATWTTATRTWAAGETLTAANMNAQLRDFANGFGAWTSYTPTVKQSATVTATITYAKYLRIQNTVWANVLVLPTSSGTSGNVITVSLPETSATSSGIVIGSATVYRSAATTLYVCSAVLASSTTVQFMNDASGASAVGAAPSYQMVNNDQIRFSVCYEAS